MAEPLVHVLVINWNGRVHLDECFETLLASTYGNARFVLLDNGSDDDSVAFVRERFGLDPRVEIVELERNLGWSGGNNAGMERALEAGAKYVLLLNNDTATDSDAIGELVAMAEADRTIGALAPKLLLYDTPDLLNSVGLEATDIGTAWDRGIGRVDGPKWGDQRPVAGVCGAGFFIRCEALRRTGLLPTDFEIYLDDLDLSLRIWDAGYRILTCPKAAIRHKFSSTMGEGKRARRKYYLNTRNRMRIVLRNYPTARMPLILLHYAVAEVRAIGRALLDGEPWRVWAHKRSWLSAALYVPKAVRERRRRRAAGLGPCQFWEFIRSDIAFAPGFKTPEDGWYPAVTYGGRTVRPMSKTAFCDHAGGALRITQVNCFPAIAPISVRVVHDAQTVATLHGTEERMTTLDLPEGRIAFRAETLFDAEQTGEPFDIGGWFHLSAWDKPG